MHDAKGLAAHSERSRGTLAAKLIGLLLEESKQRLELDLKDQNQRLGNESSAKEEAKLHKSLALVVTSPANHNYHNSFAIKCEMNKRKTNFNGKRSSDISSSVLFRARHEFEIG